MNHRATQVITLVLSLISVGCEATPPAALFKQRCERSGGQVVNCETALAEKCSRAVHILGSALLCACPEIAIWSREEGCLKTPHQFLPIDPSWRHEEQWLKFAPSTSLDSSDTFINVASPTEDCKQGCWKEVRYFVPSNKSDCRKILYYDVKGRLRKEIDRDGPRQYTKTMYANGAVQEISVWDAGRWVQGISLAPDGAIQAKLENGVGELVRKALEGEGMTRTAVQNGVAYITKDFEGETYQKLHLYSGTDSLEIDLRDHQERLRLSPAWVEYWRKDAKGVISVQFSFLGVGDGPASEIPMTAEIRKKGLERKEKFENRYYFENNFRSSPAAGGPEKAQARIKEYQARRADFITKFKTQVRSFGGDINLRGIE